MIDPFPPDTNRMAPDRAPTPFSAAVIAAACGPGRLSVYRMSEQGAPINYLHWEFTGGTGESAEYVTQSRDEAGRDLGPPVTTSVRWVDLQAHASFPEARTTIAVETVEVPAGTFECWRYTVDKGHSVSRFWFAAGLPGPPVLKRDTVDGVEVASMALVEYRHPRS